MAQWDGAIAERNESSAQDAADSNFAKWDDRRCEDSVPHGEVCRADSPQRSENRSIECFGRGFIEAEKDMQLRIAPLMRTGSFVVLGTGPDTLAMYLSHRGTLFGTSVQPVENQSFDDPLRIGQMLSAVIFKGSKSLVVKAIRPLNRLWGGLRFGSAAS